MVHPIEARLRVAGLSEAAAASKAATFARLTRAAAARGGHAAAARAWFVPGRIELLGKHTDYAGGRSLLCAVERGFCVLAAPRADDRVRLLDVDWHSEAEFPLSGPAPPGVPWAQYPAAVAGRLTRDFELCRGADIVFASDLPRAAGMSSSSALIVASFFALAATGDIAARFGGREVLAAYLAGVECGVGTHGGSEDHTAILCCQPGRWSQYAFCPVRHESTLAAPPDFVLGVGVSGVTAAKAGAVQAAYNRASSVAAALLRAWNAATGRQDVTLAAALAHDPAALDRMRALLRRHRDPAFPPEVLAARLDQFWQESEVLIPAAAAAAAAGRWDEFGACVARSQAGAESGLENQTPETRGLVELALDLGAVAASAFGAGFGGAVWALAPRAQWHEFRQAWQTRYRERFAEYATSSLFFGSAAGPAAFELAWPEGDLLW